MNDIAHAVNAYIMNPPYNGSDRANKPWTSIVIDTITHAVPGAEFLFIVPVHWRTNPGKEYTKVRTCLRTQLEFFQEHHVDASTFGVGEEISWWIARKKQDSEDQSELTTYEYFDEYDEVHIRKLELVDGHPYFSVWQEAYGVVFQRKETPRYKTKRINGTFKQLNEKEPKLVSKEKTAAHLYRLYNTTKRTGIWYTKRPLIHYHEPKMIVDISGTYYRPGNKHPGGELPIVVFDDGTASPGKNTAVFLESDLRKDGVSMELFHWYITHPIMRFLLQEKPSNHPRAKFIKELYQIPRIHQDIVDTDSLVKHLGLHEDWVTQIYAYYHSKNEDVSKWNTFTQWREEA